MMKRTVHSKIWFALIGVFAFGGCESQFLTSATIAPEIKAAGWFASSKNNDLTAAIVDYSSETSNTIPSVPGSAPVIPKGRGTFVFGFNQLLNGDKIENIIVRTDSNGDPIPNAGNGPFAGLAPQVLRYEGKPNLVEVWMDGVMMPGNTADFQAVRVGYNPAGFYSRPLSDPFEKYYWPAVTITYAAAGSGLPNATLPGGKDVTIHFLTSDTDGVTGVSGLRMTQAHYADGTPVVSPSGAKVAATIMFKTAP